MNKNETSDIAQKKSTIAHTLPQQATKSKDNKSKGSKKKRSKTAKKTKARSHTPSPQRGHRRKK
jgi:hypothetical protein